MHSEADSELDLSRLIANKIVIVGLPPDDFSSATLMAAGAKDVVELRSDADQARRNGNGALVVPFKKTSDVARSNATVAILNSRSSLALFNRRHISGFTTILVPNDRLNIGVIAGLARHRRRGRLSVRGYTNLQMNSRRKQYLVLDCRASLASNSRVYACQDTALSILKRCAELDYVLLRSISAIETGMHSGDVDILVATESLEAFKAKLNERAGTVPFDIYTEEGDKGHSYGSVPYFLPSLARKMLQSAVLRESGVRTPDAKLLYLSYCYSLLFHNKLKEAASSDVSLTSESFRKPKNWDTLKSLADQAHMVHPADIFHIEELLRREGVFPGIDLIGFYSRKSKFVRRRYLGKRHSPGLCVFFVRDFGFGDESIAAVRQQLKGAFDILVEGPVKREQEKHLISNVRGGNWQVPNEAGRSAKPIYWFVCLDRQPRKPSYMVRRKHPRLDNTNIRIKDDIRAGASRGQRKPDPIVHSSDNTVEAIEHIHALGLADHPALERVLKKYQFGARPNRDHS